jgi:hypothetical protein
MTDFATPRWKVALAEMLDRESHKLKSGADHDVHIVAQIRRIADALERGD